MYLMHSRFWRGGTRQRLCPRLPMDPAAGTVSLECVCSVQRCRQFSVNFPAQQGMHTHRPLWSGSGPHGRLALKNRSYPWPFTTLNAQICFQTLSVKLQIVSETFPEHSHGSASSHPRNVPQSWEGLILIWIQALLFTQGF